MGVSILSIRGVLVAGLVVLSGILAAPSFAQVVTSAPQLHHVRGVVTSVDGSSIEIKSPKGMVKVGLSPQTTVLSLSPTDFTQVDFGVYVGAVSEKLDDRYSPIYRDSLSWLHQALELRVIDEKLRGIALGHMKWDLTPKSVMTHGWVDDLEIRVLSIKYGPTEEEETDVDIGRDVKILKMQLGTRDLLVKGANVFIGASKGSSGEQVAAFIMVGIGGVTPGL
jgi:hypothetical protein